jgi:hypothetical protein
MPPALPHFQAATISVAVERKQQTGPSSFGLVTNGGSRFSWLHHRWQYDSAGEQSLHKIEALRLFTNCGR